MPSAVFFESSSATTKLSSEPAIILSNTTTKTGRPRLLCIPVEVFLNIIQRLPAWSYLLLSHTCRALRAVLNKTKQPLRLVSQRHKYEYLVCLARGSPDRWACSRPVVLKWIDVQDIPMHLPQGQVLYPWHNILQKDAYSARTNSYCYSRFRLCHRHVQLTLKYTRLQILEKRHQKYLESLLARRDKVEPIFKSLAATSTTIPPPSRLVFQPRVVSGRYMIQVIQDYFWPNAISTLQRIHGGTSMVCPHEREIHCIGLGFRPYARNLALRVALEKAFHKRNVRVGGSCESCATDFDVCITSDRIILTSWHDLGIEGSETDPNWRAFDTARFDPRHSVWHEPGSVRELYRGE